MVYQGWYPDSDVSINDLISAKQEVSREPSSVFNKYAFFDTFVNVEKF